MAASEGSRFRERLLLVDINRQQLDQTVLVLQDRSGALYLWSQDLERWRLRAPATDMAVRYQGELYFPLSAIATMAQVLDAKEQTLTLELRADAFVRSRLTTRYDTLPPPKPPDPGGFLNYDLLVARGPDSMQRSGLFELGLFNRFGVGTSELLAELDSRGIRVTRLDSTWSADNPHKLRSLRLGDAITAPGSWGRSLRFGGVQFASNFATQPGLITYPMQSVAALAALPSTVDVFINSALVSRQSVPPGPFSISHLPIISGAGEVQLVVRDALGREQVITRPFYASQALLREGLKSYSYELGRVRENFGLRSNDYGAWIGAGSYRLGWSPTLTAEVRAQAMPGLLTAGAGGDALVPPLGTLSSYLVGSSSRLGRGGLLQLGMERQAQSWSLGVRTQWASPRFTQLPMDMAPAPPLHEGSLSLSYTAQSAGSVGLAYVWQRMRADADTRLVTLSYSASLGNWGSLSMSALRSLSGDVNTTLFVLLNLNLGASTNLSVTSQSVRGLGRGGDFSTSVQRNLPPGDGYGYRLQARSDGATQAALALQSRVGMATLEAAQGDAALQARVNLTGGLALLGGDAFWSRRIEQSFAVARIPDYPNVRVRVDNQGAGRTDARGNALLPSLRAYDVNVIEIDQRDLPMDAKITAVKLELVPYFRTGVDVTFPITRAHGATLTLQLDDGAPMPVGATVQRVGLDELHIVGYDGEVYVVGLGPHNRLRAQWLGQSCEFDVDVPASADPLPDLGRYLCKGVHP